MKISKPKIWTKEQIIKFHNDNNYKIKYEGWYVFGTSKGKLFFGFRCEYNRRWDRVDFSKFTVFKKIQPK